MTGTHQEPLPEVTKSMGGIGSPLNVPLAKLTSDMWVWFVRVTFKSFECLKTNRNVHS